MFANQRPCCQLFSLEVEVCFCRLTCGTFQEPFRFLPQPQQIVQQMADNKTSLLGPCLLLFLCCCDSNFSALLCCRSRLIIIVASQAVEHCWVSIAVDNWFLRSSECCQVSVSLKQQFVVVLLRSRKHCWVSLAFNALLLMFCMACHDALLFV